MYNINLNYKIFWDQWVSLGCSDCEMTVSLVVALYFRVMLVDSAGLEAAARWVTIVSRRILGAVRLMAYDWR